MLIPGDYAGRGFAGAGQGLKRAAKKVASGPVRQCEPRRHKGQQRRKDDQPTPRAGEGLAIQCEALFDKRFTTNTPPTIIAMPIPPQRSSFWPNTTQPTIAISTMPVPAQTA